MKVMLVNGSSRPNGCTSVALAEVARALEAEGIQTETLWIGNKPMSDCIACGKCRQTGKCVFDDAAAEFGVRAARRFVWRTGDRQACLKRLRKARNDV